MNVEGETPSPSLQELVTQSIEQFWSTDVFVGSGGHVEIYGPYAAVADIFKNRNIKGAKILPSLLEQTSLKPNDIIGLDQIRQEETWERVFNYLAQCIIVEELYRSPGVREEVQRRVQEEDRLDAPEV